MNIVLYGYRHPLYCVIWIQYQLLYCFIVFIKTNDIYKVTVEDVEIRFDISNYELDKPLPNGTCNKFLIIHIEY